MSSSEAPAPLWFGATFVIAGAGIIGVGSGLIPVDPSSVHAPGWVIILCGGVFGLSGVAACLAGRTEEWVGEVLVLALMIGFATVFSWVAFGPGERRFSGGAAVGGVGVTGRVGSAVGRIAFGLGALMMWAIVAAVASKLAKRLRGP
ncbi:MAG: hypothetical protein R3195_00045 [Gemmatimonadota bacterium]|nr:hypothetical protein [Gemmatimonadota bacterium]